MVPARYNPEDDSQRFAAAFLKGKGSGSEGDTF